MGRGGRSVGLEGGGGGGTQKSLQRVVGVWKALVGGGGGGRQWTFSVKRIGES